MARQNHGGRVFVPDLFQIVFAIPFVLPFPDVQRNFPYQVAIFLAVLPEDFAGLQPVRFGDRRGATPPRSKFRDHISTDRDRRFGDGKTDLPAYAAISGCRPVRKAEGRESRLRQPAEGMSYRLLASPWSD